MLPCCSRWLLLFLLLLLLLVGLLPLRLEQWLMCGLPDSDRLHSLLLVSRRVLMMEASRL